MGNSLTQTPDAPLNESLLNQLKQRSLADVIECLTVLKEDYPDCQCVTYDQFSDIFGPLVDDPEPFFLMLQNNRDISGVVDVYEALAVFAIFSKDRYERKGRFIFELFDFDHNKHLDLAELTLTMQAVARGLCKAVHITPPSRESIKEECKSIFRLVDQSGDGKVSVAELRMYVKHNAELQEFLLKYAEIQTFANIKARFDKREIEYLSFFDRAVESNDLVGARVGILKNLIEQREKSVKLPDIELLLDIMLNTTVLFTRGGVSKDEGLIIKEAYEPIMKAWCAYLASDFNHNNILEASELHALLWLYEGKEPNQERINFEMGEMGKKDLDGILIGDFLKNLCVMDKNGNYALRPTLKKLFEKYDKDGSGYLSFDELKAIIYESFEGYAVRQESQKVRDDIEEIVRGLTKEIFKELDRNGSTNIAWDEFKKFMEVSLPKIDKLRLFLDMNLE